MLVTLLFFHVFYFHYIFKLLDHCQNTVTKKDAGTPLYLLYH